MVMLTTPHSPSETDGASPSGDEDRIWLAEGIRVGRVLEGIVEKSRHGNRRSLARFHL